MPPTHRSGLPRLVSASAGRRGVPASTRLAVLRSLWSRRSSRAGVAQLAERQPSKLHVAGSNPVSRSTSYQSLRTCVSLREVR